MRKSQKSNLCSYSPERSRPLVAADENVRDGGLVEGDERLELRAHEQRVGHDGGRTGHHHADDHGRADAELGQVGLDDAAIPGNGRSFC